MGILKKIRSIFHEDWCSKCQNKMDERNRSLYMLPMTVGHYVSHKDANYYKKNVYRVSKKSEIPAGTYACGMVSYKCPNCGNRVVRVSIFLPVRDQEKLEETFYFENGEFDQFFIDQNIML